MKMFKRFLVILIVLVTAVFVIVRTNNEEHVVLKSETLLELNDSFIDKEVGVMIGEFSKTEMIEKINKNISSNLSEKGEVIVNSSLKHEVDPILVTSVILHESGCYSKCSGLVKACNNFGGHKGSPNCVGSYRKFNSVDEGLDLVIENISKSYIKVGLNTVEKMAQKYTGNKKPTGWINKVNWYYSKIKES